MRADSKGAKLTFLAQFVSSHYLVTHHNSASAVSKEREKEIEQQT